MVDLTKTSIDQLTHYASPLMGTQYYVIDGKSIFAQDVATAAKAELERRRLKMQLEATEAQKLAAQAQETAAKAAIEAGRMGKINAWIMLASVGVALISAVASAVSAYYAYWIAVHPK